jgi:hypothetical protein
LIQFVFLYVSRLAADVARARASSAGAQGFVLNDPIATPRQVLLIHHFHFATATI